MLTRRLLLSALLLLSYSCAAIADVPAVISYQGKLMQPSGAPVPDGTYSIRYAIYDSPTADTPLWSETNSTVQVKGGLFSVLLGSQNNLPANIFDSAERYFAIKVNTDGEMVPRQRIGCVAYATRAASADIALTVPDGAITTAKLTDQSVTSDKLADQSVTADKLTPGAASASGTISMFAGLTPPTGWLVCDGSAVSRTTYAALFAVVGTAYGAGDGTTTFNLPNLQDRFPLGKSGSRSLGLVGGATTINVQHSHTTQDHVLTIAEMPSHTHTISWVSQNAADKCIPQGSIRGNWQGVQSDPTGGNAPHNHGNTSSALSATQDIMNPYVVVNYIIKL